MNDFVSISQDCGNKLVESGCVSQEEVRGIQFYLIASVVDGYINVNVNINVFINVNGASTRSTM